MKVKEIVNFLEQWAPPSLQESYDNSGLLLGEKEDEINSALITLDITEAVVDEAVSSGNNLIIAHHPFIFKGLKKIGNSHWIDRCIRKAIQHEIAIYAIHTNLDNVHTGVNKKIADKIGLLNSSILQPKPSTLSKLTVFVPTENKEALLAALYNAGAGHVGNYDHCSFQLEGTGTFRGNEQSNPTIGAAGKDEEVSETRIEVIIPKHSLALVLHTMKTIHPYEEVAYYLQELMNENQEIGSGMIGYLPKPMNTKDFFTHLKSSMNLDTIRHTDLVKESIERVALCGGSGSFLLGKAIRAKADVFITADFKYHDFFEANGELIIADIGHYESEVFTKDLLHDALTENFTKFAFRLSKVDTNPIKYL
ncbi:MAG: Nif3-like dinuclear metal center hexameric protein [Bacteroidota bacterium]